MEMRLATDGMPRPFCVLGYVPRILIPGEWVALAFRLGNNDVQLPVIVYIAYGDARIVVAPMAFCARFLRIPFAVIILRYPSSLAVFDPHAVYHQVVVAITIEVGYRQPVERRGLYGFFGPQASLLHKHMQMMVHSANDNIDRSVAIQIAGFDVFCVTRRTHILTPPLAALRSRIKVNEQLAVLIFIDAVIIIHANYIDPTVVIYIGNGHYTSPVIDFSDGSTHILRPF